MKILCCLIAAVILLIGVAGCVALPVPENREDSSGPRNNEASGGSGSGGILSGGTGSDTESDSESDPELDPESESESDSESDPEYEGFDWSISVDDTVSGTYKLPAGGKSLRYDITLRLVAWKSGGKDVYGTYEGEAYIVFNFDESGLSGNDLLYMGGAFNRRCERLEFEVEAYDQEELNRQTIPIPDSMTVAPPVAPLGSFNAMASFISSWSTVLQMDQTIRSGNTGGILSDFEGVFDEGTSDNMGLLLLISKDKVTVDIPTYRLTWNCGYFRGTLKKETLGTAKRERLEMPDTGNADQGRTGEGQTSDIFEMPQIPQYDGMGTIITDENGITGFDINGDDKIDVYTDENGVFHMDLDFDGEFDEYESESGMG